MGCRHLIALVLAVLVWASYPVHAQPGTPGPPGSGGVLLLDSSGDPIQQCREIQLEDEILSATGCGLTAGSNVVAGAGGCVAGGMLCDPTGLVFPAGIPFDARNADPYFQASGTSLPSTCTPPQTFLKTNEPFGLRNYECTATDTWTRVMLEAMHARLCGITGKAADTQYFSPVGYTSGLRCHTTTGRMCWSSADCPGAPGSPEACDVLQTNTQAGVPMTYRTIWAATVSLDHVHGNSGTYTLTLNTALGGDKAVAMTPGTAETTALYETSTGVALPAWDVPRWKITSTTDSATSPDCMLATLYVSNRQL